MFFASFYPICPTSVIPIPAPRFPGYGPYGHVRRLVLRAGRTFTDRHAAPPDSSDTDSGSGTDSEESCCGCIPVKHVEGMAERKHLF